MDGDVFTLANVKEEIPVEVIFGRDDDASDITLEVEGKALRVHKSILQISSPVFKTMLTANFREKTAEVITLPGKKSADVVQLLQIIYPTFPDNVNGKLPVALLRRLKDLFDFTCMIDERGLQMTQK